MNTVGPYHNRQETYNYFSLPFCKGPQSEIGHYHETLGEALQGVELEFSGLEIGFKGRYHLGAAYMSELRIFLPTYCWLRNANRIYNSGSGSRVQSNDSHTKRIHALATPAN